MAWTIFGTSSLSASTRGWPPPAESASRRWRLERDHLGIEFLRLGESFFVMLLRELILDRREFDVGGLQLIGHEASRPQASLDSTPFRRKRQPASRVLHSSHNHCKQRAERKIEAEIRKGSLPAVSSRQTTRSAVNATVGLTRRSRPPSRRLLAKNHLTRGSAHHTGPARPAHGHANSGLRHAARHPPSRSRRCTRATFTSALRCARMNFLPSRSSSFCRDSRTRCACPWAWTWA